MCRSPTTGWQTGAGGQCLDVAAFPGGGKRVAGLEKSSDQVAEGWVAQSGTGLGPERGSVVEAGVFPVGHQRAQIGVGEYVTCRRDEKGDSDSS
jgi:hypothetical protein